MYVCAFRGRRDDYQVPLALDEVGQLDKLITDAYAGATVLALADKLPGRWRDLVQFRHKAGLSSERVQCLWGATLHEHFRHRAGYSRVVTYTLIDQQYSRAAEDRARATQSHLLLYTPYAWEAFTASYKHQPKRVLFQYHPHAPYEERLLRQDFEQYPEIAHSFAQETGIGLPDAARKRVNDCWQHADRIISASSFTQQTLLEAGADPARCVVAPYGIERAPELPDDSQEQSYPQEGFRALFVGSGVQRKGLHHLLRAWERATLPKGSELTLVCRVLDPGLRDRVARTPGVKLLPGTSRVELARLYQESSLFVMPSLIEGFGQVYLEALAAGCPVLGTANTCLPDVGTEKNGVFLVNVVSLDHLVSQLERLASWLPGRPELRTCARACAATFTWSKFRAKVIDQL